MPSKAKRTVDRLMPALSRSARTEVCARSRAVREQLQSEIVKSAHAGHFIEARDLANEGTILAGILEYC